MSWLDVAAIAGGLVAGVLSGLIGIGGGLAFVPILTLGFRTSQIIAQGTSLAAIVPTALVGGVTHIRHGNVDARPALLTGAGGVAGAIAGALIAVHVSGPLLTRVFGVLLLISAFLMFRRARSSPLAETPETQP